MRIDEIKPSNNDDDFQRQKFVKRILNSFLSKRSQLKYNYGDQDFKQFPHLERLAVLTEELGEIAQEVIPTFKMKGGKAFDPKRLRGELLDLITPALMWVEDLEREEEDQKNGQ